MSIYKKILGHIYFYYSITVFLISMLIVALPVASVSYLFKEPTRSKITHPAYKLWTSIVFFLIFCPVRRKGLENFKKGENYDVVIKHNSYLHMTVSAPWITDATKACAKYAVS